LTEFDILHCQFDLENLKFMDEPLQFILGPGEMMFRRLPTQRRFSAAAQCGGFRQALVLVATHN
jgi:hypothetical protein